MVVISSCFCSFVNRILNFEFEASKFEVYCIAFELECVVVIISRCSGCDCGYYICIVVVVVVVVVFVLWWW